MDISDSTLIDSADEWIKQAESEHKLVNIVLDEDPDLIKGRLMLAMDYIDQECNITNNDQCKIVVFTAHNATLTAFLKLFNLRYKESGITAVRAI